MEKRYSHGGGVGSYYVVLTKVNSSYTTDVDFNRLIESYEAEESLYVTVVDGDDVSIGILEGKYENDVYSFEGVVNSSKFNLALSGGNLVITESAAMPSYYGLYNRGQDALLDTLNSTLTTATVGDTLNLLSDNSTVEGYKDLVQFEFVNPQIYQVTGLDADEATTAFTRVSGHSTDELWEYCTNIISICAKVPDGVVNVGDEITLILNADHIIFPIERTEICTTSHLVVWKEIQIDNLGEGPSSLSGLKFIIRQKNGTAITSQLDYCYVSMNDDKGYIKYYMQAIEDSRTFTGYWQYLSPFKYDLLNGVQNKISILEDSTTGSKVLAGKNSFEYRYTATDGITSLTLSTISTPVDSYSFKVIFKSGTTATTITNTLGVYFTGDGCVSGVFTPVASTIYNLQIQYNGFGWVGKVIISA